ncbi:MAG: dihydrodipicolinate synthase family protein [Alphaproteobacteria bacterium]|nr:dihydrodipicolinate synthase family protein [Rhodospirillaceae bacterium]MDP6404963.1 dihydrodipicolinate synthase family protein [Alphaproteobacteria bacterium]MDP6623989.1 dihydrodipicolinate synthase family protein [Alphaproteobacteria bacterium]
MTRRPRFAAADLGGIVPPMTTPFRADGSIDEKAFRGQVRFLTKCGAHGLAVGGSTGEGHTLSTEEVRRLVAIAVEEAGEAVPIIAGIIVDSTQQAIERGKAVADLDVAALQITPVHYLFRPDDDHMLRHFEQVAKTVRLPILIYNVVPWTYLSPELLVRIMKHVPRVIGVKQSAGDMKLLADLMMTAPRDRRIFSAVDALLYPSFALGADGAIAAILAAAPQACVALWDAVRAGDHKRARRLHEGLLRLWNAMPGDCLPACTKYAQSLQGVKAGRPRAPMQEPTPRQKRAIAAALAKLT